jgi:CzcA family heavy metal efflux pump
MIRWIVGSSLKFRFLVVAAASAMMFLGVGQLRHTAVDVFPEFAPPRVEIQTACLGLSAAEVESLVSVPLEASLNGVPKLDVIRSKSVQQLSSIELLFKPGTDLMEARQVVQERLSNVITTLPTWAAPPVMMPPVSATSRVMKIGVSSRSVSMIHLSTTAYWKIRARMLRVPGVANVAIWGERLQQMHVEIDPERLRRSGVSLEEVMENTSDALDAGLLHFSDGAVIGTGGFIDMANQRLTVRHVLPIIRPADLAKIPLHNSTGKIVRMSDVARVIENNPPMIGDAVVNDGPGLMLVVEKLPWGNTVEVTRGVEAALDELRPGLPGIEIDSSIFRPASFVEAAIGNLTTSLLLGLILVMLVLGAFLFDWRSAVISAVTIPLSLVAAGLVLHARGATVNTMVLAGFVIALGAIVDDAIVDIENIVRRLRQHRREGSERSTASIILEASLEVRSAVVYASFIEVVALLPVFFLKGLTGAFFRPLAMSYALAILVSLGIALTVTPALAFILLRRSSLERRESPLVVWLRDHYERILSRIITAPRRTYLATGAVLMIGFAAVPFLGQNLFPDFKERDFLMHWVTTPGTSLPEEDRVVVAVSKELRSIPGVRNFGSHIGQAFLADEVAGVNFGENWISIGSDANYDETVRSIREVVDGYPGMHRDVQTYLGERIREVLSGSGDQIVVRVFGEDLAVLRDKGNEIKRKLAQIPGVIEQHVELQAEVPQIEVDVDLAAADRYGIKPGDVRRASAAMLASEEVGDIFRDGRAYDVHVFSTPEHRVSVADVQNMWLDTPGGGHIRLREIASVHVRPTPNVIHREGASRIIDVGANVRGRDLGSVVHDVQRALGAVKFPLGYRFDLLGEYAERQAAQKSLLLFAMLAALGILLLLFTSFGSMRLATLSFITLPMAMIGGVIGAFIGGRILSLGSIVGFFTVLGIVARNGIMLISHCQHLERHEGEIFGRALVLRSARERLAPILMTMATAGLALVPLLIKGNVPGQEIEYPMAQVILGGLVTSTLLNLFVVPSLYLRFGRPREARAAEGPA